MIRDWTPDADLDDVPALWRGMPEDLYHACDGALSASSAKVLLGKRPPDASAALAFGTLAHTVLLEPHRLGEYVALDAAKIGVKADGTPAAVPTMTGAWKRAVAEAEQDGKIVVDQADWDKAHAMADAARAHPAAAQLLDMATEREVSAFAQHPSGALTERTRGAIFALFAEHDITERDGQLAYIADVLGRELGSRADLSEDDGLRVEAALRAESP